MIIKNKIMNLGLRNGVLVFAASFLMNILVHLLGHYVYFITKEVDLIIYAIEILGFCISYKAIRLSKVNNLSLVCIILKGIIIAECISCFIYATDGCLILLLLPCTIAKYILEFCFYIALLATTKYALKDSLLRNTDYKIFESYSETCGNYIGTWIAHHVFGVIFLIAAFYSRYTPFFILLLLYLVRRIVLMYRMIKILAIVEENAVPKETVLDNNSTNRTPFCFFSKVIKYGFLAILTVLFIVYLVLKNTYTGDMYLVDAEGNLVTEQKAINYLAIDFGTDKTDEIYQYKVKNMLPGWTLESDSKYGLLNIETGDNTGPIYDERLEFDYEDLAWDGNGHIINTSGEVAVTLPSHVMKKRSEHQRLIDNLLFHLYSESDSNLYKNENHNYMLKGPMVCDCHFFTEGIGIYYCDLNGKYGLISDDGKIITDPIYDYAHSSNASEYLNKGKCTIITARINRYGKSYYYYINNKGETILVEDPDHKINVEEVNADLGYLVYSESSDNYESYKFITFDGEILSDQYRIVNGLDLSLYGNYVATAQSKNKKDLNTYAIGKGGKVLFKSDQYTTYLYWEYYHEHINYLIAKNRNGNYELINLEGEQIIPGEFIIVKMADLTGPLVFARPSNDSAYPTEVYIYKDGNYVIEFLSQGDTFDTDFGYGYCYYLNQDEGAYYYWILNIEGMYEFYSLDGELIDTTTSVDLFESEHQRLEKEEGEEGPEYPEAVTSKYGYVEYGGYMHYAVTNDRPSNLDK